MTQPPFGTPGQPPADPPPSSMWQQSAPVQVPQSYPLPLKKKPKKWPWIVGGVVVLIVAGSALSNAQRDQATGAASTTSAKPTTTVRTTTTTTTTTTTKPPPPPPSVFKGSGDDVITLDRPAGVKIAKFECPACTSNTMLKSDGFESLLVNEIGAYSGQMWLDIRDGSRTTTLTVKASGAWTLTVGELDMATKASGPVSGKGDSVVFFSGKSTKAKITNVGESNFIVHVVSLDKERLDLAVNHIGSYEGTVPLAGPALIQITSSGSWSITPG
ncbi:hypothetical protein Lesp02_34410 [Lentzea sp. NBRC 105346]|uniref:hypothetical protein n=1 Tax=Lentzea sp. NBRC 105346 TaxID=3032205 RepID=UPI0024A10B78|nr:hypothetical protein [Lentzea sp. NBRC 105346]GLZ31253.1 hypothetical protein Lesp02_34410 [Lentzea sp. NBRC 105346]